MPFDPNGSFRSLLVPGATASVLYYLYYVFLSLAFPMLFNPPNIRFIGLRGAFDGIRLPGPTSHIGLIRSCP